MDTRAHCARERRAGRGLRALGNMRVCACEPWRSVHKSTRDPNPLTPRQHRLAGRTRTKAGNKGQEDWKSKVVAQLLEDEKKKSAAKMGGKEPHEQGNARAACSCDLLCAPPVFPCAHVLYGGMEKADGCRVGRHETA